MVDTRKAATARRSTTAGPHAAAAAKKKAGPKKGAPDAPDAQDAAPDALAAQWQRDTGVSKTRIMPMLISDKFQTTEIPRLREFDPSQMKLDGTVVAIGKRRTGKSWAFRHILHSLKGEFDAGICISQTDELNMFWRQYMPSKYIFNRYSPVILQAVFDRQKAVLNDKRLTEAQRERKARFFIILDDVISDTSIRYSPEIAELFVAGRHYKLFVLITTQYAKAITPTLRSNADYVLILMNKQEGQREALWRDFADFMTKEGFYTLMDAYTEDNEILTIDNSEPTAKPWEIMHWFKASDPGAFKLGNKEYWKSVISGRMIPTVDGMGPVGSRPEVVGPYDA